MQPLPLRLLGRKPQKRLHSWSWTGRHGAARACRLSIEAEWEGHEAFFIKWVPSALSRLPSSHVSTVARDSGHDTTLTVPTVDAIAEAYPGVPIDTVSLRHTAAALPS